MEIQKIALNGFRNYEFATAEFSPGTNVISGENAQGKTNLLEAVYLLTGGKSFRTRFDKELIGFGYSGAEVLADVTAYGRSQTVKIALRQGQRKQIFQNGVKKTATELSGSFAAVLFCPDDLNLIRDGAAARRRMTRRRMPSPRETPAKPAAMPVAKGFTVELMTPAPAPSRMTEMAVTASYPSARNTGISRGKKAIVSSHMP